MRFQSVVFYNASSVGEGKSAQMAVATAATAAAA